MSATAAILTSHYWPTLAYMAQWLRYEQVYLEAHENYQKGSYRNRTHIIGGQGVQRLSIPLRSGKHQRQPIQQVAIDGDDWRRPHWQAIRSAYGRSPYYEHYAPYISPLYLGRAPELLFDWNLRLLQVLHRLLQLPGVIATTGSYRSATAMERDSTIVDLRAAIHPKRTPTLVTGYRPVPYAQVFQERHGFVSEVSALDLLFCAGPEAPGILQRGLVVQPDSSRK